MSCDTTGTEPTAAKIAPWLSVAEGHGWRIGRVADPSGHHWVVGKSLMP
jgi:PhnB protein